MLPRLPPGAEVERGRGGAGGAEDRRQGRLRHALACRPSVAPASGSTRPGQIGAPATEAERFPDQDALARISPNSAVGHRGLRGKAREHREFGKKMVRRAVHLWGECTNSRRNIAKHLSVFSFRLSSASVTCPNCRF